jgi:adenine-specific DNA-methyltransferase
MGTPGRRPEEAGHLTDRGEYARLEAERVRLQRELDASKTAAARNRLGQFATPQVLAREMLGYAREMWRVRRDRVRFLDPAVGTGSFFSALVASFPATMVEWAMGVDVDAQYADAARRLWAGRGLQVVTADFTTLPPPGPESQPNLIVANPPYVRHHHVGLAKKRELRPLVAEVLGGELNGLAGLYCYFILLAHRWLAPDGIAMWLVPSEFMDVNYGSAIKRYLTERVTLLRAHRFDPADVQFDDALVSSSVLVFRKAVPRHDHRALFSSAGSLLAPGRQVEVSLPQLRGEMRWSDPRAEDDEWARDLSPGLASLFSIKRGIATGANGFFILKREEARRLGIDESFLTPILPSPRYLRQSVVDAAEDGYPMLDQQLVLIDSILPESDIEARCPGLYRYLEDGKVRGVRDAYLVAKREPWYRQERRPPAPFLCTYMGRRGEDGMPFRFIWNRSRATATNVYLLLYPTGLLRKVLSREPALEGAVFEALQSIPAGDFLGHCRVYGGGLYKAEPAELGRVPAARILDALGISVPRQPKQQALF